MLAVLCLKQHKPLDLDPFWNGEEPELEEQVNAVVEYWRDNCNQFTFAKITEHFTWENLKDIAREILWSIHQDIYLDADTPELIGSPCHITNKTYTTTEFSEGNTREVVTIRTVTFGVLMTNKPAEVEALNLSVVTTGPDNGQG